MSKANFSQRFQALLDPTVAVNSDGYLVKANGLFDHGNDSTDYVDMDYIRYNSNFIPLEGEFDTSGIFSNADGISDEYGAVNYVLDAVNNAAAQQQQSAQASADRAMDYSASEAEKLRAYNADQAELNRQFQADQAQKAMDYQTMMSNTAYQRAMADLQAAGINPKLVAQLGGASTPSGVAASGSAATSQYSPGGISANMAAADVSAISQVLSAYITGADAMDRKQVDFVQGILSALVKIVIAAA